MNEPKKRGRPSKADIEARYAVEVEPVIPLQPIEQGEENEPRPILNIEEVVASLQAASEQAQALAERIWAGQSDHLKRETRIERVKKALAEQGLSFEGVTLPPDQAEPERIAEALPQTDLERAQSLAKRIWQGQSGDVKRGERIRRIESALHAQNLSSSGIVYPADIHAGWPEA